MTEITKHLFTIKVHDKLGVLERILRVIRHRGGYIHKMEMQTASNQTLNLTVELTTERSIVALQNQIEKLIDVISIET